MKIGPQYISSTGTGSLIVIVLQLMENIARVLDGNLGNNGNIIAE